MDWLFWLPDYASPLSPSITPEDCNFLYKKGAFDIPDARVRDELLRSYIQFVHPTLPILNLGDFLMVIDKTYTGSGGISFLLFQAVMFAATAFETEESLALEGFKDRREARQTRFDRLRMLYSFGCEDDRVSVLQTVLLMTHWDGNSDDGYDAWYFVGEAKAIWRSIKMKLMTSETEVIQQSQGLWKRISWSCYIRDRLAAISMRRPFHIDEAEFQTPMLGPWDFEVGPILTKACLGRDGSHPAIRDTSMHRLLAQISIALVQCCKCITRILNCQYAVSQEQRGPKDTFEIFLIPKCDAATSSEVLLLDSELEQWHDSLPELLQWHPRNPLHKISKHLDVLLLFRAMLSGIYNIACGALHRPQLASDSFRLPELVQLSYRRVNCSAIAITNIYSYFKPQGRKFLHPDGQVAMLETAITTHLSDLMATNFSTRLSAIENFQLCTQALQQLKETYPSAELALAFVDAAVQKKTNSIQTKGSVFTETLDNEGFRLHDRVTGISRGTDEPERRLEPTISQKLDNLNLPQVGDLLCSHFMMTPSGRSLLQALLSPETGDSFFYSENESYASSSEDAVLCPSKASPVQDHQFPADVAPGHLVDLSSKPHDHLEWDSDSEFLSILPYLTNEESKGQSQFVDEQDDWELFQMMSQYCME